MVYILFLLKVFFYGPYHTIRTADGNWPYPFGDVLHAVSNGNQIGTMANGIGCATNSAGDLHVLVINTNDNRLYHTIRTADGNWPYPFGDVLGAVSNGNQTGLFNIDACGLIVLAIYMFWA